MELFYSLNPQQQEAVEHLSGPLLVLAGAGSGKTRVVTCRIVKLLEREIPHWKILGLTFTNKAAQEMQERVKMLTSNKVTLCTFHSLGMRILREAVDVLGYERDFVVYDEEDAAQLLKGCMRDLHIDTKDTRKAAKTLKNLISRAKNNMIMPDDVDVSEFTTSVEHQFPTVYKHYQQRLRQSNALDFDDLLFLTVRLFRENPDVLKHFQKRWEYLLVDEYQDTNAAQYTIVSLLTANSQNLFVVGDPDQSIYSWRGADIHNILNFEKDFPNAKVIRLEQNYRSRCNILNGANALISHNASRYDKNLWSDRGEGEKITIITCSDERQEARTVIDYVCQYQRDKIFSLGDMVIFYRTNFQSRIFEDELLRRQVPYVIVGGISFYQRREVKDILAFLRMVYFSSDYVAFARTINIPKRGIGEKTVEKLQNGAIQANLSILDYISALVKGNAHPTVKISKLQQEGLQQYVAIIRELQACYQQGSLEDLVMAALRHTGYLKYLALDKETEQDRKENVFELAAKAAEWEESVEEPSLQAFLEELTLKSNIDDVDVSRERMNLMTAHNGKGLEFPGVFVVGLEEDLFPHINSRGNMEAIEEERRLCYVGMTRAKERLFLTWCRHRHLWGGSRYMRPSRFIREVPSKYVEVLESEPSWV